MGKRRKGRKSRDNTNGESEGGEPRGKRRHVPYDLSPRESALFTRYYQMQGIVPEGEWEAFYTTLQQNLTSTFRITGHRRRAKELMRIIRSDFFSKMVEVEIEGQKISPPKCINWYPDELAWQLSLTRKEIRSSDALKQLHTFLITETESGNISRQEVVSMIPPLVMDIQPHHKILDMCAAPGSKTAQIIEYLHSNEDGSIPSGYVIANDRSNKRCYLMVHQVKRLQSPCFMIVNHDATLIPNFFTQSQDGSKKEFVNFDRILADVPCSGDGTLRKNQELWIKWNPGLGMNLHGLQTRILQRGLELLEIGGRLVYSTCSFNPIENEAVVASTLLKCQGSVRLVDVSEKLPGLKYMKGLSTWKVVTKKEVVYEKLSDVAPFHTAFVKESMFPPSEEDAASLNLHYCMRILPHHQDTGGFFVSVLEKVGKLPWMKGRVTQVSEQLQEPYRGTPTPQHTVEPDNVEPSPSGTDINNSVTTQITDDTIKHADGVRNVDDTDTQGVGVAKDIEDDVKTDDKETQDDDDIESNGKETGEGDVKQQDCETNQKDVEKRKPEFEESKSEDSCTKRPRFGHKEQPFIFFSETDPVWPGIRDFFCIKPTFRADQLMYRCEGGSRRTLYFVSEAIKALAQCNADRVKFINMGVKAFGRSPSPVVPQCDFRLAQEGLESIISQLDGRRVPVTRHDVITMLTTENPLLYTLDTPTQAVLEDMCAGSVLFQFTPSQLEPSPDCVVTICGWRGKVSVRPFLTKDEIHHYLRLFGASPADIKPKEESKDQTSHGDQVEGSVEVTMTEVQDNISPGDIGGKTEVKDDTSRDIKDNKTDVLME